MQTPAGYESSTGDSSRRIGSTIVFNPSFPYRLAHTVSAFYVTTAFVVLGVGAYTLRAGGRAPRGALMMHALALSSS